MTEAGDRRRVEGFWHDRDATAEARSVFNAVRWLGWEREYWLALRDQVHGRAVSWNDFRASNPRFPWLLVRWRPASACGRQGGELMPGQFFELRKNFHGALGRAYRELAANWQSERRGRPFGMLILRAHMPGGLVVHDGPQTGVDHPTPTRAPGQASFPPGHALTVHTPEGEVHIEPLRNFLWGIVARRPWPPPEPDSAAPPSPDRAPILSPALRTACGSGAAAHLLDLLARIQTRQWPSHNDNWWVQAEGRVWLVIPRDELRRQLAATGAGEPAFRTLQLAWTQLVKAGWLEVHRGFPRRGHTAGCRVTPPGLALCFPEALDAEVSP